MEGNVFFFADGKSSNRHESDFDIEVWNSKQNPLPKAISVEKMQHNVKVPMLQFATQPKLMQIEESNEELEGKSYKRF